MPKTTFERFFFTLLTSGCMIFSMGVFNIAAASGGLTGSVFVHAAHSFPLEWLIGFLLAFFPVSAAAPQLAFRVAQPQDRPIFKILCIQTFTVLMMVPCMSLVGALESAGLSAALPLVWLQAVVLNFIVAWPLQLFAVGPLCRWVFRCFFRNASEHTAEISA